MKTILLLSITTQITAQTLSYNLIEEQPNLYLDPVSETIGCTWKDGIVWDKPLIQKFYSLLANHEDSFVVLDIGAQTGSFSLLAKFFPNSQWYAFEPIREAAQTLQSNLALNSIQNVSVIPVAASNFSGQTILHMPPMDSWGLATIGSNVLRFTPIAKRTIACVDLDSFVTQKNIQRVDFIKVDTEGWELHVLQGAQQLIQKYRPILLIEHNETNIKQCNSSIEEIERLLNSLNYEWTLVSSEDLLCLPKF